MSGALLAVVGVSFGIGLALSFWQARRRLRDRMADEMARRVEQEIARRVAADLTDQYRRRVDGDEAATKK